MFRQNSALKDLKYMMKSTVLGLISMTMAGLLNAQQVEAASLTRCQYKLVDKIGGLYNYDWMYRYNRYDRVVTSQEAISLEKFHSLIDEDNRQAIQTSYQNTIEDPLKVRFEITPLTESNEGNLTRWFYHYKRVQWGSSAQDSEVSHDYSVDIRTLECF